MRGPGRSRTAFSFRLWQSRSGAREYHGMRHALRITIHLVIGAVATFAGAWLMAWSTSADYAQRATFQAIVEEGGRIVNVLWHDQPGAQYVAARWNDEDSVPAEATVGEYQLISQMYDGFGEAQTTVIPYVATFGASEVPSWPPIESWVVEAEEAAPRESRYRLYEGAGWSWVALYSVYDLNPGFAGWVPAATDGGIELEARPPLDLMFMPDDYRLPIRPAFVGFALNTIFYAALSALAVWIAVASRGAARRDEGRCPRCDYDVQGALDEGCPECGWRRPGRAVSLEAAP